MSNGYDSVQSLRAALQVSPDNLPLRELLANTLLGLGKREEAEEEYRQALAQFPRHLPFKIGLAEVYFRQGKDSHALVIVEDLLQKANAPPQAHLLYARLLLRAGDVDRCVQNYKMAVAADPSLADESFEQRLGIDAPAGDDVSDGRLRAHWGDDDEAAPHVAAERPKITFRDVGGMDAVKEDIRMKIIHPLAHAELFKAYGKSVGGGLLMYGPPGCGKTHLARATAGEIDAAFISVGISDVLEMWIGNSERNLHQLFEQARRSQPCVLFFDEVDALGASRTDMRTSGGRHLINQFLSEMDGVQSSNEGVLILAATNAPWHLDSAFRRPGRFDRILFVPPPDLAARASVLRVLARGKPADSVDFDHVAQKTDGFSGADLMAVLNVAIEEKLRQAMRDGIPKPLATKDLLAAAKTIRPSTKEWFSTARNYALYSNQGGVYDDILKYLKM